MRAPGSICFELPAGLWRRCSAPSIEPDERSCDDSTDLASHWHRVKENHGMRAATIPAAPRCQRLIRVLRLLFGGGFPKSTLTRSVLADKSLMKRTSLVLWLSACLLTG